LQLVFGILLFITSFGAIAALFVSVLLCCGAAIFFGARALASRLVSKPE